MGVRGVVVRIAAAILLAGIGEAVALPNSENVVGVLRMLALSRRDQPGFVEQLRSRPCPGAAAPDTRPAVTDSLPVLPQMC